ncbi:leucine-rich repeat protein [Butyrivibrio sp. JL13D10]|uniref:leucine-rich repeat protein n=1 Tax=Butyrivibrio sp. JL13D10 TaxID=3236815 RepID=UPI0038B54377
MIEVEIAGVNENSYHPLSDTILSVDGEALEDIAPYKVVGIADYAFKDNKYIREFHTLPTYYFKYVGKGAFEGCTNLRKFGSFRQKLTTIKARAFYGCRSLNSFVLTGNKLKHIGKNAFTNSGSKIKLTADSMDDKQVSKVKRMFKKAGAKKIHIKRIS